MQWVSLHGRSGFRRVFSGGGDHPCPLGGALPHSPNKGTSGGNRRRGVLLDTTQIYLLSKVCSERERG